MNQPIFNTRGEAFLYLGNKILTEGISRGYSEKSDQTTEAIFNVSIGIKDYTINDFPEWRKYSEEYMKTEILYYFTGDNKTGIMNKYKLWKQITNKLGLNWNNYGWHMRLNEQGRYCAKLLAYNKYSRQAVATLMDYKHEIYDGSPPCNISVQWYIVDSKVHTSVNVRSNDLWFGFPYDTYWWGVYTENVILDILNKEYNQNYKLGTIYWNVVDLHVYYKQFLKFQSYVTKSISQLRK